MEKAHSYLGTSTRSASADIRRHNRVLPGQPDAWPDYVPGAAMVRLPPKAIDFSPNAAAVAFGGLISLGLYRLNSITPPATANGDHPIGCAYGGSATPAPDLITMGQ